MWTSNAACANSDPELFFDPGQEYAAVAICRDCKVRIECLTYAIKHSMEFGVWGGVTGKRRRIDRRRFKIELLPEKTSHG